MIERSNFIFIAILLGTAGGLYAGPYNQIGISGYIGDDWHHADPLYDANAVINPVFSTWADTVVSYVPSGGVGIDWRDPAKSLGPATGDHFDIVSLGDLSLEQMDANDPGFIILGFDRPISDVCGYEFAVFENGLISGLTDPAYGFLAGEMFAEWAYVEVSSDGVHFARFDSVSLTAKAIGPFGSIDITNIYNLAGRHPNGYGICMGTPFDLAELQYHPSVVAGLVDLADVNFVRIVDIPGNGGWSDSAIWHTEPGTWPNWQGYPANHPIYDAWLTTDSAGFDLEAIGVLNEQRYAADINMDGIVDTRDFVLFSRAFGSNFGQAAWLERADLAEPSDLVIDVLDLTVFTSQWLCVEDWRK